MSTNRVLNVLAIAVAAFAAWVWVDVADRYSFAVQLMDYSNCTFACNSRTVSEFWNVVVLASFASLTAVCFSAMAAVSAWDRDEVLSFDRQQ